MEANRFLKGVGGGVLGTLAMSAVMIAGTLTGLSPMPKPIPIAIVERLIGAGLPKPALVALGAGSHFLYGGVSAGILALIARPVTVRSGVVMGVGLWLIMQLLWLPFLGWGMFGTAVTPRIAGATLLLHLLYGIITGWAIDRRGGELLRRDAGNHPTEPTTARMS